MAEARDNNNDIDAELDRGLDQGSCEEAGLKIPAHVIEQVAAFFHGAITTSWNHRASSYTRDEVLLAQPCEMEIDVAPDAVI